MATRIQIRGGTAAAWAAGNPVLASREPAVETDTGKEKIGDGVTPWNSLPYKASGSGGASLPLTTKGDLVVGTGGGSVARLPVGADGQVLQPDAAQATGVKWAAAPSATSTVVGGLRLAGDLGGTAASPTVPGLAGKVNVRSGGLSTADFAASVVTSLSKADTSLQVADKGVANGVAGLGPDGKVPSDQLPASSLSFPLGSANNPVKDHTAARPNLGTGIAVWWDTAIEPVNWADGDYQLDAS